VPPAAQPPAQVEPARRPSASGDEDLYQTGAPQPQGANPNANPLGAEGANAAPAPEARRIPTLQESIHALITQDPAADALSRQSSRFTDEDRTQFERNLAEIVAFTNQPGHEAKRPGMLAAMETSLKGPQDRGDGAKLFTVLPRYVGENVPGFDNWNTRGRGLKHPGARYEQERVLSPEQRSQPQAVVYYSPEQQKKAQVYVREDGQLGFANGKLADGEWIFVVDKTGRMMASRAEQGKVHHSSLSGGEPVLMAGDFKIQDGKLTTISNKSGHFRPDEHAFQQFLAELQKQKVTLTGVTAPAYRMDTASNGGFMTTELTGNMLAGLDANAYRTGQLLSNLKAPPGAQSISTVVANPIPELQQPAPQSRARRGPRSAPTVPSGRPAQPGSDDSSPYNSGPNAPGAQPANGGNPPTTWWRPAAPPAAALAPYVYELRLPRAA
jgi:hypothetical protein